MKSLIAAILSTMLAANAAAAATIEVLTPTVVTHHCASLEGLALWLEAGNKFGATMLDRAKEFEGCSNEPLPVEEVSLIAFVKGFGLPLALFAAKTSQGEVYSFVPVLPGVPKIPGVDA